MNRKIAYLNTGTVPSSGADSIHIVKMCSAFAAPGNRVTLILPQAAADNPYAGDIYEYYGVPDNFAVKRLELALPRISTWKSHRYAYKIAGYISKEDFDVIYTRDIYICYFAARVFHKPVYFEYHAPFEPKTKSEALFRSVIKSPYFRKMIVITQALKRHFISQYHLGEDQLLVAPDGADEPPGSTVPAQLTGKSGGKFQVGYIGHLYKGRGMELLGDMAVACPFAFFHIIGGRKDDAAYWKDQYRQTENIHFYGFVPPAQTASYGMGMDVLIAPYQKEIKTAGTNAPSTAEWMSPLKIFEYMALGKPIISSDMPVLKEVLTDGENSILCPYDDAGAWSRAIKKLHEDTQLSEKLASGAKLSIQKYTWKKRAGNILEFISADEPECCSTRLAPRPVLRILQFCRLVRFAFYMLYSHRSRITFLSSTR